MTSVDPRLPQHGRPPTLLRGPRGSRSTFLVVVAASLMLVLGCGDGPVSFELEINGDFVSGTGRLGWISLEGGFVGITSVRGRSYVPRELPPAFASRVGPDKGPILVRFAGTLNPDVGCFCGLPVLELSLLEEL